MITISLLTLFNEINAIVHSVEKLQNYWLLDTWYV